jgi:hypothetical protein
MEEGGAKMDLADSARDSGFARRFSSHDPAFFALSFLGDGKPATVGALAACRELPATGQTLPEHSSERFAA